MRKKMKKYIKILLSIAIIWLLIFLIINYRSIIEFTEFNIDNKNYKYLSDDLVPKNTDYKILYDLVNLNKDLTVIPISYCSSEPNYNKVISPYEKINYYRMLFIMKCLDSLKIKYDTIWVPDKVSRFPVYTCNIFIKNGISNNFTLITAHYDNLKNSDYQGALDNSASVTIILNVIQKSKDILKDKNVAFLFSTMEEQGLIGAQNFLEYSKHHNFTIKKVICLDGVGRGKLSIMNNCMGSFGFKYRNLFFKEKIFTGSEFRDCPKYSKIDNSVIDFKKYNIKVLNSFLSSTDGRVFIKAGIPTVHLTSSEIIHFLKVMHRSQDKIDGLNYKSLKHCEEILYDYVKNIE
jgi:hypothetical protein